MKLVLCLLLALVLAASAAAFVLPVATTGVATAPPGSDPTIGLLPADRSAWPNWKMAGLQSIGGIPTSRSTICATLTPLGGTTDDAPQIQSAINACAAGGVVLLGTSSCTTAAPCNFRIGVNSVVNLNKGITLRGQGGGATVVAKPTDFPPGSGLTMSNCPPTAGSAANYGCFQGNGGGDIIRVSPFPDNTSNTQTACALTADTVFGATSLQVTSGCASNFHVGDVVLLDEDAGSQWMPDSMSNSAGATTVCANDDYRVVYQIYNTPSGIAGGSDASTCPPTSASAVYGAYTLNPNRVTNELKKISAVSGSTITFDSPIMQTYRVSHTADLWFFGTQPVSQAGVEKMTVANGSSPVLFYFCQYCWAYQLNVKNGFGDVIAVWASLRTEINQNYVHECAWPEPGEVCYNLEQKYDSTETYWVDNISVLANKVMAAQASGAGSVYAYNYVDKGYIEGTCCWQEMGLNMSHLTGPHHALFEGNLGFNMDSDDTHGGSSFITFYRNWSTATRAPFQGMTQGQGATTLTFGSWNDAANTCGQTAFSGSPLRATGPAAHSYWFSFIGNIFGTPSCTNSGFPLNNLYGGTQNSDGIFLIGWINSNQGQLNNDPITRTIYPSTPPTITCAAGVSPTCAVSTASCTTYGSNCSTILYNNFDYVHNAICDNGVQPSCIAPTHTIPNSFYLTAAPPFFVAGYSWPWVNPASGASLTTANYDNLPARFRYDNAPQTGGGASGIGCASALFQNNSDCQPFGSLAPGPPTISGVTLSNGSNFNTPAAAGSTVTPLVAHCAGSGSCAGATLSLPTVAGNGCTTGQIANNSSFAISGNNLVIGGSTVNAGTYAIGIQVSLAGASNTPQCYPQTLVGANPPAAAWDPTHKSANVTLSGSPLIVAKQTAASNGDSPGYGNTFHNSSKYTFSVMLNALGGGGNIGIGLGTAAAPVTSGAYCGSDGNSICAFSNGTVHTSNTAIISSSPTFTTGNRVWIAVDLTNDLMWIAVSASPPGTSGWFGNGGTAGNPDTGTNGIALSGPLTGSLFPGYNLFTVNDQITADFTTASGLSTYTTWDTTGGAGIACDVGPNFTGTIPAGASAAGFTHCAANYDFTSAVFGNAATFVSCPGQTPTTPRLWTNSTNNTAPCSDAVIATDTGGGGNQALKISFTTADYAANNGRTEIDTINPSTGSGGNSFPMGMYIDVTVRSNSQTVCPGCPGAQYPLLDFFWLWWPGPGGNLTTTPFIEQDLTETFSPPITNTNPLMNTFSEWKTGCPSSGGAPRCFPVNVAGAPGNISGFNQTQYVTYGARTTQTSSGTVATCSYINDVQLSSSFGGGAGCGSGTYLNGASDPSITQQNTLIMWTPGLNTPSGTNCGSASCDPGSNPTVTWYKSIVVWTCATPSSGCISGSLSTGTP